MKQLECGFHTEIDGDKILIEAGPAVQVVIGFDDKSSDKKSRFSMDIQALVDTGAKSNHIDATVAKVLMLPIVDHLMIAGSNGKHSVDVYFAKIHIPGLEETILGRFAGVKLVEGGSRHGAILGRSFLKKMRMSYDGASGRVTLLKP